MSRIGKMPIPVPKGDGRPDRRRKITVKGPLGTLTQALTPAAAVEREGDQLLVKPATVGRSQRDERHAARARGQHGQGRDDGFERRLTLVGVGYRAQAQGDKLNLSLGFSHPVVHALPEGVKAETPTQTEIVIKGTNKQQVGQVAAEVRGISSARALQGQGRALLRREGRPERDQEEVSR